MSIQPSDVIQAVRDYGEPEIAQVLDGLCGCGGLLTAPLDALLRLAEAVASAIESKSELDDMRSAVQGADATVDATEAEVLGGKI